MHINSLLLFEKYAKHFFKDNMKILEIGPNGFPSNYKESVKNNSISWDTIDLFPNDNLTYLAINEYKFPIEDNYYDIVLSGQVIEHVRKIWIWVKEISRVCKTGGLVVTINPISYPFHKIPYDCWRIYPEGMKALYEDAGLKVLLSVFNSLEQIKLRQRGFRNIIPGKSCPPEALMGVSLYLRNLVKNVFKPRLFFRFLLIYIKKLLGWPINCSFDTITIGKKLI